MFMQSKTEKFINFMAVLMMGCIISLSPAHAVSEKKADISHELNQLLPASGSVTVIDPSYVPANLENLMKVYANIGVLDTANPAHLDQYLAVTECSLYKEFRSNEFEWAKIRIASQESLNKHKDTFSKRFEFVQPIYLNEFDFAKGGFPLIDRSAIPNVSKIQITNNAFSYNECLSLKNYDATTMPINAALSMDRPFSFGLVPSDQQTAQKYVDYLKANNINTRDGRPAYLKFRVKIDRLLEKTGESDASMAIFYGQLENISVYGDRDQMIKLYDQNF